MSSFTHTRPVERRSQNDAQVLGCDAALQRRVRTVFDSTVKDKPYPRTLTLANDNTARPGVGRPIDVAGRNVVKINIFFTAGKISCASFESDNIR